MPDTPPSDTGQDRLLVMGRITGAHGLEGNIKVWSFAESTDILAPGNKVFVGNETADDRQPHVIESCVVYKKGLLIRLSGIDSREQADELIGRQILVHRSRLPEPDGDVWYWQDLYGLTVMDQHLGELGTIDTLFSTGAHDILVVKDQTKEILIPMHRQFVTGVDLEKALVFTRLPEGFE